MKKLFLLVIGLPLLALALEFSLILWPDWPQYFVREKTSAKVVWVINEQPVTEGVVVEAPIPLGGGICLVGVNFGDLHENLEVRAVLVLADHPIIVGQKVKVKARLISETYREAFGLRVMQDDIPK